MDLNILRYDSLSSTNDEAADQARRGAREGVCIIAGRQTTGRGRHGRTWESPPDAGLYLSLILRPQIAANAFPLITLMAGVAACDALLSFGIRADIKWVNDLLVDDKKIAGILAETVETPTGTAVILGIGVNVKRASYSPDIAERAVSIEELASAAVSTDDVAEALTRYISYFYDILLREGPEAIIRHWQQRSSYFSRKPVSVMLADRVIQGVTDGLEANGALRVKLSDDSVVVIQAGDVERLRLAGS